jgi:hypothetical protein
LSCLERLAGPFEQEEAMMRSHLLALAVSAALLVFGSSVWGDDRLDERVSLAFEYSHPKGVFEFLASPRGYHLSLDPSISANVSIRLEGVRLRTALDALCESAGCRWQIDGDTLSVVALPASERNEGLSKWRDQAFTPLGKVVPAGVRFDNVSFSVALDALAKLAGPDMRILVPAVREGQVLTASVGTQTIQAAVRSVVEASGLPPGQRYVMEFKRDGYPPVRILAITPKSTTAR